MDELRAFSSASAVIDSPLQGGAVVAKKGRLLAEAALRDE
jgi:hypothetical protein